MTVSTTITATVASDNAVELADMINHEFAAGNITTVNGRELLSRGAPVARSWQNGTVSVTVRARTTRGATDLFVKVGRSLEAV